MIKRLQNRFIRITMLSVTLVLVLLSLIVNIANFVSTNSDLNQMLDMIYENQGTIPTHNEPVRRNDFGSGDTPPQKPGNRGGPFNQETPYSTRYFCLRFDQNGTLADADLAHIAAISEADTGEYAAIALQHGEGYGYVSGYKYYVVRHGENRYMAIFLDCYQEMHAVQVVALCSLLADGICILLVYILVVLFSKKAIAPVVRSAQQQKQFITDAGHELKTPITVIATSLKVLEMETGKQKWINKAQAQTEKLKDLVNSLVTLSRMDEEDTPLRFERFPISDAVSETAESFRDFAASNGHELQIAVATDLNYNGDEYAIRQLVSILLDNAIKYATAGTPIRFSLEKAKKGVVIRTYNPCEKMEQEDLEKLFDRFYRADKSRNPGTGGFGIGLSIARSIAEGHRGSIRAKCPTENEIEFTVELK